MTPGILGVSDMRKTPETLDFSMSGAYYIGNDLRRKFDMTEVVDKADAWDAVAAKNARIQELEAALTDCQKTLAMLVDPKVVARVGVLAAWANCVASEAVARNALNPSPPLGAVEGGPTPPE